MHSIDGRVLAAQYQTQPALKQLRDQLGQIVADTVIAIARDTAQRIAGDPTVAKLTKGLFYCSDYFVRLRKLAATKATVNPRLQQLIDDGNFYFGYPPKYFTLIARNTIQIKPGVLPSVALNAILQEHEFALVDCPMVCQMAQLNALLHALGKEKFDLLFSHETGKPLMISGYHIPENSLLKYLLAIKPLKGNVGMRHIEVGQWVSFNNVQNYLFKHQSLGEAAAFNVICSESSPGRQKFVGHGLDPHGLTEAEVEQVLVDEYNKAPKPSECLPDTLAKKFWPLGLEEDAARRGLLAEPHSILKEGDYVQVLGKKTAEQLRLSFFADPKKMVSLVKTLAIPIKREEIAEEGFGYTEELNVIDLNIELIQQLIQKPLAEFTREFILNLTQSTEVRFVDRFNKLERW